MKKKLLSFLMVGVVALTGCTGGSNNQETEMDEVVEKEQVQKTDDTGEETVSFKEMTGEEGEKLQVDPDGSGDYLFIDVRPKEEYDAGHLMYAINILSDHIEKDPSIVGDKKDTPILVYCNTGNRSKKAAQALVDAGYKDVTNLEGVKDYSDYTLQKHTNLTGDQYKEILSQNIDVTIIDSRDQKSFDEGHIEGAILVTPDTLEANMDKIPKDKPVYAYCWVGYLSGQVAETLTEQGYEAYNCIDGTKEYEFYLVQ